MPRIQDIPDKNARKKKMIVLPPKVAMEREIRRYVKINGGFRKDLPPADKKIALDLLKQAKRKLEDGWDLQIVVPGFEQSSASPRPVKAGVLLEKSVVDLQKENDLLKKRLEELEKSKRGRPPKDVELVGNSG